MRFLCLIVVVAAGCGLNDYEKRMDTQRERLKHFDEENRVLGDPLKMPKIVTKDDGETEAFPFEIFFRPPKEISDEPGKEPYVHEGVLLFRYRGGNEIGHVLVAAANVADKPAAETDEPAGETPEEFQRKTLKALQAYSRKIFKQDMLISGLTTEKEVVQPLSYKGPWPRMEFDRHQFVDKTTTRSEFRMYFHRKAGNQVGVIYQIPLEGEREIRKAIEHSLKTLAIEPEKVDERKAEFDLRTRFRP